MIRISPLKRGQGAERPHKIRASQRPGVTGGAPVGPFQEFRIVVVGEEGPRGAARGPGLKPAEAVCRPTTWRLRARIALARVNRGLHAQGLSFRPPDLAQRCQGGKTHNTRG